MQGVEALYRLGLERDTVLVGLDRLVLGPGLGEDPPDARPEAHGPEDVEQTRATQHRDHRDTGGHTEPYTPRARGAPDRFTDGVAAAAGFGNASTRFTDGEQFGFGAEIGISTQKLHARGPMGLRELTTTKYVVTGSGQIV